MGMTIGLALMVGCTTHRIEVKSQSCNGDQQRLADEVTFCNSGKFEKVIRKIHAANPGGIVSGFTVKPGRYEQIKIDLEIGGVCVKIGNDVQEVAQPNWPITYFVKGRLVDVSSPIKDGGCFISESGALEVIRNNS